MDLKFSEVMIKLSDLETGQNQMNEIVQRNDRNLVQIFDRLETFERRLEQMPAPTQQNQIFTQEQIVQARDALGLDLNQELVSKTSIKATIKFIYFLFEGLQSKMPFNFSPVQ